MLLFILPIFYQVVSCVDTDQGSVKASDIVVGLEESNYYQLTHAIKHVLRDDFGINLQSRESRQIDRTESLLDGSKYKSDRANKPLQKPTGEKTRKTYDFTKIYHVGLSCHDIQANQGATISGIYLIHPPNLSQGPWKVYCDLETEGGGWMVFQVRDDVEPHENFMRGWEDYKVGFGDFDREFWLGNILIWALSNVDNSTFYELAVDMEDWSGNRRFARYRSFRLGSERDAFRMYHQNLYYGNAGDSMYSHNGLPFSTFDVDNDNREGEFSERSCARLYKGGWWYGNCHDANLNGWYLGGAHRSFADGINWYTWTGYNYSLKKTVMKMRPQVNGPIDVGYGNYILTGTPDRQGRVEENGQAGTSDQLTEKSRESSEVRGERRLKIVDREVSEDGKYDVSELLTSANTLTNPNSNKYKKSEL